MPYNYGYESRRSISRKLDDLANSAVYNKVCKILAEQFDVEAERLEGDTSIINDLGAKFLDVINLMITIEDEFGVIAPDDECLEKLRTIRELTLYIERAEHRS